MVIIVGWVGNIDWLVVSCSLVIMVGCGRVSVSVGGVLCCIICCGVV